MSTTTDEQIARLKATIQGQERDIAELESEVVDLHRELEAFEVRYNRIVKGVAERVAAIRQAIEDLEALHRQQRRGLERDPEALWREINSSTGKQSQPEPKPQAPRDDLLKPRKKRQTDDDLKTIYRRLARRYHPDLAEDETDRARRNRLMAMINEAYENQDRDALLAIAEEGDLPDTPLDAPLDTSLPLNVLTLRRLQQQSADLAMRLEDLKIERTELMHSPLMDLKLQEKLDRAKGDSFLEALAEDLNREYWALMRRMDTLRNQL